MDVIEIQELLVNEFTADDQRLFVHNFQCYLRCDADHDFVIDFDEVYRWVGFTRKGNAKRILQKWFAEGKHYTLLLRTEEEGITLPHGGNMKETIMLTPNAFKEFCMRADTHKANEIRSYYIKMERLVFKGMEIALQKANERYMTATEKILALENDLKKYQGRKRQNYSVGDTVYIVKERGIPNLYKVGCSENMNSREMSYFCHSNQCVIVYTRRCKDRKFLEKAVHNRFESYRYNDRTEWFQVPFEVLRKAIEDIQILLEGELCPYFTFDASALEESNVERQDEEPIVIVEQQQEATCSVEDDVVLQEQSDEEDTPCGVITTETILPPAPEFARFLQECYDVVEGYKASWVEMGARFRLWMRSTHNYRDELANYLQEQGYKETFIFDEKTKTNSIAYSGLRMKPIPAFVLKRNSTEVERFLFATCRPTVTGRATIKQLREAFLQWKCSQDAEYNKVTLQDQKAIKEYCNKHFLASTVHDGTRIRFGYYGLCLKGSEKVGRKTKPNNRKGVEQVHPISGEVVGTYDSITHAAKEIGVTIAAISVAISANKHCKGFLFRRLATQ